MKRYINNKSLILFLTILLLGVVLLFNQYLIVKKIIVTGGSIEGLSSFYDKPMLTLSTKTTEQSLYDRNPQFASLKVIKKFPQTLNITVKQSSPIALFVAEDGWFVVTDRGRIREKMKSKNTELNLPEIKYYQKFSLSHFSLGDTLDQQDVKASLFFIATLESLGESIMRVEISDLNMIVLKGDREYIFSGENVESQAKKLESIIVQFRLSGKTFNKLDLRFDKPILSI